MKPCRLVGVERLVTWNTFSANATFALFLQGGSEEGRRKNVFLVSLQLIADSMTKGSQLKKVCKYV